MLQEKDLRAFIAGNKNAGYLPVNLSDKRTQVGFITVNDFGQSRDLADRFCAVTGQCLQLPPALPA